MEPDWICFFDPKADWRDSLQHFNLQFSDYIGGEGGVGITQMVHGRVEETTFPIRDWTLDCPPNLPRCWTQRQQTQKTADPIACIRSAVWIRLKLLALGYLGAQVRQSRPQIFMGIDRRIPDTDLIVQM